MTVWAVIYHAEPLTNSSATDPSPTNPKTIYDSVRSLVCQISLIFRSFLTALSSSSFKVFKINKYMLLCSTLKLCQQKENPLPNGGSWATWLNINHLI